MVCLVKDASLLVGTYGVRVSAFPRASAVILTDQRSAAFSLCGLAAAHAEGDGTRKMKNPPADRSGRVCRVSVLEVFVQSRRNLSACIND